MREDTIQTILREVDFENLIRMISGQYESAHDVFAILNPLLTQVHRVDWHQLASAGSSWVSSLDCIDRLCQDFKLLQDWTEKTIAAAIEDHNRETAPSSPHVERLLYISLLSSEFRLPLARAIHWLGRSECVVRLDNVAASFRRMHLIG